ncbi:MAG: tRNA (guanine(10)-N(2))-dimethyltransferase [Promethearchaeia archaeon]
MEKKNLITKQEGLVQFYLFKGDQRSIPSKSMNVFYNKKMRINRDMTSLAINAYNQFINPNGLRVIDAMAASGVGAIRMLKESQNIEKIYINDINPTAVELIRKNLKLNSLSEKDSNIEVSRKDANFLFNELSQRYLIQEKPNIWKPNVISIDPFGTPNLYLDAAVKLIQKQDGLFCITATDTAVLFGVRSKACQRKYMAKPLHNDFCKEIGARILFYFLSRLANFNGIGIKPLLVFYHAHFVRIFGLTYKNKNKIAENSKLFGYLIHCRNCDYRVPMDCDILDIPSRCPNCGKAETLDYAGPLWIGKLHDKKFVKILLKSNRSVTFIQKDKLDKLLSIIAEETNMPISYYDIHKLSKKLHLTHVPKMEDLLRFIREQGFSASRTHFEYTAIKTDMDISQLKEILLEMENS